MSEEKPKHPTHIEGYYGSLEALANAVGGMRYDKLAEFLDYLANNVQQQAQNDADAGKTKLSAKLNQVAKHLYEAQEDIDSAWKICKPYMKTEE
jgi:ABC-type transporter Mla subunit MlaD